MCWRVRLEGALPKRSQNYQNYSQCMLSNIDRVTPILPSLTACLRHAEDDDIATGTSRSAAAPLYIGHILRRPETLDGRRLEDSGEEL
jgi:hypothetical protein